MHSRAHAGIARMLITCMRARTHTHIDRHTMITHTHTRMDAHAYGTDELTHRCTDIHTRSHARAYTCTYAHMYVTACAHRSTRMLEHMHK